MKNGSISEQLELQNQNFTGERKIETSQSSEKENMISYNLDSKQYNEQSNNQQNNSRSDSVLSVFSLADSNDYDATLAEELHVQKRKKKGIRR